MQKLDRLLVTYLRIFPDNHSLFANAAVKFNFKQQEQICHRVFLVPVLEAVMECKLLAYIGMNDSDSGYSVEDNRKTGISGRHIRLNLQILCLSTKHEEFWFTEYPLPRQRSSGCDSPSGLCDSKVLSGWLHLQAAAKLYRDARCDLQAESP